MRSWYLVILLMLLNTGVFAQTFSENFDVSSLRTPPWRIEGWKQNTSTILSTEQKRSGTKSFKAHLPAKVYSNARTELRFEGGSGISKFQSYMTTYGTRISIFVPKNFKPDNTSQEIILQYHRKPDANDKVGNPHFTITLDGNKLVSSVRYSKGSPSTASNQVTKKYQLGTVTPGQWHNFVLDIRWDYRLNGNGFAKVYMRKGSLPTKSDIVLNYNGPISSQDADGPYLKFGIYKWDWKVSSKVSQSKKAGITERLLYFDNVSVQKGGIFTGSGGSAPSVSIAGGNTVTLPTNSINLTANASAASGSSISSYRWTKVSGPSAKLSGTSSKTLRVTGMQRGSYAFRVVVTDSRGRKTTVNRTVNVVTSSSGGGSTGTAPSGFSINAGKDMTVLVTKRSFELKPIIPSGVTINRLRWKKISGPSANETYTGFGYKVSAIKVGTYVYEVFAEDSRGRTDTDRVRIVVKSGSSIDAAIDLPSLTVRNFTTNTDSVQILNQPVEGLKVHLKNVNGVELRIENFNGELNTEVIRHGMYQYDVVDDEGAILQKGTLLIY